ncbi:MAG TPA: hypothetical protein VHW60_20745 [Caulobacteraceae bacterium]|jgi:hypothetical protein|nr:hypothetical protein [Caulobacteraceae bacterium]
MLSTSLTLAALAVAPPVQADAVDVYDASTYTYCDAVMASKLWHVGMQAAKAQIGTKIMNGIGDDVNRVLAESRAAGNRCSWEDAAYLPADAVQLSHLWGVSVQQAKAKIATYVTNGQSSIVNGALGHGPPGS